MTDIRQVDVGATLSAHRGWFIFLGVALAVAGVLAIVFPLAGGLAIEIWVAIALLLAGGAQVMHAFAERQWQGGILSFAMGLLYIAAGAVLWLNPIRGVVTLTALLAAVLFVDGILRIVLAFRLRAFNAWIWMLISGVLGVVVAVMIWQELPSSAVWALGLLLGVNLIFSGIAFASLASAARPGGPAPI